MTLATAILLFAICFASVDPGVGRSLPQSDSAGSAPTSVQQAPSNPTTPESTKPSSEKPPSQTPAKKPKVSTGKKTGQTKKVAPAVTTTTTCDPLPTNGSSAGSNPEPAPPPASTQEPTTPEPQKNCPTSPHQKKIVQQGGITEQSIQLAGGSDDEATKKRDANRLLATTKDNLKKLSGRQLSSAEESSVSQIVQFVKQSETAAGDGDLERAYTLALKAQLLSDDLVNPRK